MPDQPKAKRPSRVWADFNGFSGNVLCLTHTEFAPDERGEPVILQEGMEILAFDEDADAEGNPDRIIATGTVTRPPDWLQHRRSFEGFALSAEDSPVLHAIMGVGSQGRLEFLG